MSAVRKEQPALVASGGYSAEDIIKRYEQMRSGRGVWESHWREIAERIRPTHNQFQRVNVPGQKQTDKIFDSTAALALERFGAAMESMLTPRTQTWHKVKPMEQGLAEDPAVMAWCDEVTRILFAVRYAPKANFASQAHECYMDVGAFGSSALFVEDVPGSMIRYKSMALSSLYFAENHVGQIDTVYRLVKYTTRQVLQRFGDKTPPRIREAAEKEPDKEWNFVHCVMPNADRQYGRITNTHFAYYSAYVWIEGRTMVSTGGFRTFPFPVGRYATAPNEIYGRGPAMIVLPTIKMLNEMKKTLIRAAQKVVDPPMLLSNDGALSAFAMRPGSLNYGYMNEAGVPMAQALETKADVKLGLDLLQAEQTTINEAFLVTLFQILVETPQMTATEALMRAQEKGALLAPTMGRQQSEFLGPMIEREIDILAMAGVLPPMPPQLLEAGGQIEIEYVSPLNKAQRADEGVAILTTLQQIAPLAQVNPGVLDIFDSDQIARELADINGMPAKTIRSPEDVAAIKQQKAQAAQAQQLLAAAPVAASALKDVTQAQAMTGSAPQTIAGAPA